MCRLLSRDQLYNTFNTNYKYSSHILKVPRNDKNCGASYQWCLLSNYKDEMHEILFFKKNLNNLGKNSCYTT
jgi:hypothetical protein